MFALSAGIALVTVVFLINAVRTYRVRKQQIIYQIAEQEYGIKDTTPLILASGIAATERVRAYIEDLARWLDVEPQFIVTQATYATLAGTALGVALLVFIGVLTNQSIYHIFLLSLLGTILGAVLGLLGGLSRFTRKKQQIREALETSIRVVMVLCALNLAIGRGIEQSFFNALRRGKGAGYRLLKRELQRERQAGQGIVMPPPHEFLRKLADTYKLKLLTRYANNLEIASSMGADVTAQLLEMVRNENEGAMRDYEELLSAKANRVQFAAIGIFFVIIVQTVIMLGTVLLKTGIV